MKFFVAKVDPKKVKFEDGRAALSPLRFHYDSDEFTLPIRLGLANTRGHAGSDRQHPRAEPALRGRELSERHDPDEHRRQRRACKDKFGAFYAALFDRTLEKNPGAVVTEYAWQATTCDPCPGPTLDRQRLRDARRRRARRHARTSRRAYHGDDFVLTRLHARYGKDVKDDLVFSAAPPIVGGREFVQPTAASSRRARSRRATNNFQGRYAIRHPWTGADRAASTRCAASGAGRRPSSRQHDQRGVKPALDLAFAPRGEVQLAEVVMRDVPEIDVTSELTPVAGPRATPHRRPLAPATVPAQATRPSRAAGRRRQRRSREPRDGLGVLGVGTSHATSRSTRGA